MKALRCSYESWRHDISRYKASNTYCHVCCKVLQGPVFFYLTVTSEISSRLWKSVHLHNQPNSRQHRCYANAHPQNRNSVESENTQHVCGFSLSSLILAFLLDFISPRTILCVCFVKARRALVTTLHTLSDLMWWLIFGWYICESTSVSVFLCISISCLDIAISHITVWKVADASYCYYYQCVGLLLTYSHISNHTSQSHW